MNFSGVLKAFKDFVTGTPTDSDYFLFGNTDIKKISLSNLKTALGIAALNSSLNNRIAKHKIGTISVTAGETVWPAISMPSANTFLVLLEVKETNNYEAWFYGEYLVFWNQVNYVEYQKVAEKSINNAGKLNNIYYSSSAGRVSIEYVSNVTGNLMFSFIIIPV